MNVFCLLTMLMALCHSAFAVWPETHFQAVNYLLRYGYLNPDYSMRSNPSKILHYSVKNFQKKSLLEVTGHLDKSTMHQMQKKRCGVPDFSRVALRKIFHGPDINLVISRRDATLAKWNKTDLTYFIKEYTSDIGKEAVDETIADALKIWSDVSKLTFTQVNSESADIIVKFVSGEHGDGVPFDGPGGTLAHAYFPETNVDPMEGDAHFDNDETWTLENKPNGTNLFCTAVHEFGHSLGLSHTYSSKDIMFPYETDCYPDDFKLSDNDIYHIQLLYGQPDNPVTGPTTTAEATTTTAEATTTTVQTTTPTVQTTSSTERPSSTNKPTTPSYSYTNMTTTVAAGTTNQIDLTTFKYIPNFPELCKGFIDAITVGADGNIYVFIDILVFILDSYGIGQEYYTPITEVFPEGPKRVDSAFTVNLNDEDSDYNGYESFTYLIQDRKIWKYYFHAEHQQFQLAVRYPRNKNRDFPRAPNSIRAAFYMNGKAYFVDRNSYTEYYYDRGHAYFEDEASIRSSEYLKKLPRDNSINAASVSDDGNLNVFIRDDWYVVDPNGAIIEKFKTQSFFGCDLTPSDPAWPTRSPHWHGHKYSPHKHSPRRHKHSPHKHHKHSPHRHKHSPKGKKHKKKSKRHRKKSRDKSRDRRRG